jgi:hypothetical protein
MNDTGKNKNATRPDAVALNWTEQDFENRIGIFKAGRYTSANKTLGLALAVLGTAAFFALLVYVFSGAKYLQQFTIVFIRPGNIYTTGPATFFFLWAIALLVLKRTKLNFQERALGLAAVPQHPDFILNEASARAVLERIHNLVDHPRHFILLNRIDRALSNLRNIGGLGDVATILKGQAENDENQIASSYTLVSAMVWAIPVLGFIGTVQGLSSAISTFTKTLASSGDLAAIKTNLQGSRADWPRPSRRRWSRWSWRSCYSFGLVPCRSARRISSMSATTTATSMSSRNCDCRANRRKRPGPSWRAA